MSFFYNLFQFSLLSTVVFFLIAYSPTFVDVDPQPHRRRLISIRHIYVHAVGVLLGDHGADAVGSVERIGPRGSDYPDWTGWVRKHHSEEGDEREKVELLLWSRPGDGQKIIPSLVEYSYCPKLGWSSTMDDPCVTGQCLLTRDLGFSPLMFQKIVYVIQVNDFLRRVSSLASSSHGKMWRTFLNLSPVQLRPLKGPLTVNEKLNSGEKRFDGDISSPESLAVYQGKIYTGTGDGRIIEISGTTYRNISLPLQECSGPWDQEICGRPLGIRVSSDGFIYVTDAFKGLLKIDRKTGVREVLIRGGRVVDGKPLMFLDDLVIDERKNVIYMTDASWKWNFKDIPFSLLELLPTGRVLKYDLKTGTISTLTDGFIFTNGIQMSHDQKALLVAESVKHRIMRYHLEGSKKGQKDVFVDRLPGYPDNIRPSKRGGYWVAMALFKDADTLTITDYSYKLPLIVRKVMLRIMDRVGVAINFVSHHLIGSPSLKKLLYLFSSHSYWTALTTPKHGIIIEVDKDGNIINSMHSPNGDMQFISEVLEHDDGNLYLGSFANNFLGVVPLKQKN